MNALRLALLIFLTQALPQPVAAVQGTIKRFGDGIAISNARVELIRIDGTAPHSYASTSLGDGSFVIQNVRPGTYRLTATRTGFLRREFGQRTRVGLGIVLSLEAGQQLRNLDIELRPAAVISGRVTDSQGEPVAAAEVRALVTQYAAEQRLLRIVQSTITNDLGEYRLFGLAAGPYYVSATAPGENPTTTLVVGPASNTISAGLFPSSNAPVYFPNTTDSRLSPPIDVSAGGEFSGVNIITAALKTYHIRGSVPGGMASVTVVPADPGLTAATRNVSAEKGPFDAAGIASGEYMLVARSMDYLGVTSVNVRDNDVDGVVVGLNTNVGVPTRVTIDDGPPSDDDPDMESINVNLLADPPIPGAPPDVYGPFPDGHLSFQVLVRLPYRVTNLSVRSPRNPSRLKNAYIKSIRMGDRDVLNDGFRVDDPEKIQRLEIVVGTKPGMLTGMVVDEKQKPEVNATVVLVPEAGRRRWADAYRTATTDLSGHFTIDRIAPGDYIAYSWEEIEDGAWMEPGLLKRFEDRGRRVHITENNTQNVSIVAIP